MGVHKMIVGSPPFQTGQELWGLLGGGPGAACQRCHSVTYRQIHPLNKSGVQLPREAHPLQGALESGTCSKAYHVRDPHQLAPSVAFLHLTVNQSFHHLPLAYFPLSITEQTIKLYRFRHCIVIEAYKMDLWKTRSKSLAAIRRNLKQENE